MDRQGFSLIELLTVLVLIGLITAFAAPSMSEYVDRTNTRRALDRVVTDISFARVAAVERGRRTSLSLQADGTYTISVQNTDGSWTVIKTVDLTDDFPGITITGDVAALEFSSRGLLMTALAGDSFVKMMRGDTRDSVFVSPAGRVYRDY